MGGKGFYLDLIGWARSRDAIIRGITGKKHIGGGSFLCSRTRGGARGGTLIEINLDIYSRQSAGYTGHCSSINAPTYLQLQPGDITFELIIHDRGIRGIRKRYPTSIFLFPRLYSSAVTRYRRRRAERCHGDLWWGRADGKNRPRRFFHRDKNLSKLSPDPESLHGSLNREHRY